MPAFALTPSGLAFSRAYTPKTPRGAASIRTITLGPSASLPIAFDHGSCHLGSQHIPITLLPYWDEGLALLGCAFGACAALGNAEAPRYCSPCLHSSVWIPLPLVPFPLCLLSLLGRLAPLTNAAARLLLRIPHLVCPPSIPLFVLLAFPFLCILLPYPRLSFIVARSSIQSASFPFAFYCLIPSGYSPIVSAFIGAM